MISREIVPSSFSEAAGNWVADDPRVEHGADGAPLASPELVLVVGLPRRSDGQLTNLGDEQLCGHAMSFGAQSFETERKDGRQRAFAQIDDARTRIANFEDASADAKELRANLYAATKKPVRTVIGGKVYILHVRVFESFGGDAFEVSIDPAPKLDPSVVPPFTARQSQYLAFIHNYTKIHRCPPAESDLQYYFRVSPPAIHDMIKTLERNGFIERKPGQARSIRLLVAPEYLPRLK